MTIVDQVASCLREFLKLDRQILRIDSVYEAYKDILCGQSYPSVYFDNDADYNTYKNLINDGIGNIEGLDNIKHRVI